MIDLGNLYAAKYLPALGSPLVVPCACHRTRGRGWFDIGALDVRLLSSATSSDLAFFLYGFRSSLPPHTTKLKVENKTKSKKTV